MTPAVLLRLRFLAFLVLYLPFCSLSYGYSSLNGMYYVIDKDYDGKPGWSVGVNMARKSCLTHTVFEDGTMLMLGGDHSRGDITFFAMMSGKRWKYVGDKPYAAELHLDDTPSWSGKAFGVAVSGRKGLTVENLSADDFGRFAQADDLALVVNGTTQARVSLDGSSDAIQRVIRCMLEVETGRVELDPMPSILPSLDARNHPETTVAPASTSPRPSVLSAEPQADVAETGNWLRSELPATGPEPSGEPAPQQPEEKAETNPRMAPYDRGENWHVDINKADQVCQLDLSLGKQRAVFYTPVMSGLVQYTATFVDSNFPSTKNVYEYEIRGDGEVLSHGTTNSFAYKGHGYHSVYELTAKILNAISRSKALMVKFDGNEFGSFDMHGFSRGFDRLFGCVEALGIEVPREAPAKPDRIYDRGNDWSVFINKSEKTCGASLDYGAEGLILNSRPPGAQAPYHLAIARDGWRPGEKHYEFELGNEKKDKWPATAYTFESDGSGFAVLNGLNEDFLDFFFRSKTLQATAKGFGVERYDLSRFGPALQRFSDCLKETRGSKSSSRSKVRRMN